MAQYDGMANAAPRAVGNIDMLNSRIKSATDTVNSASTRVARIGDNLLGSRPTVMTGEKAEIDRPLATNECIDRLTMAIDRLSAEISRIEEQD
jgi:cob(I)alamin adenosyltransferase